MRRFFKSLVLLLVLAVLINVLIAWACAQFGRDPNSSLFVDQVPPAAWPWEAPADWPAPERARTRHSHGLLLEDLQTPAATHEIGTRVMTMTTLRAGWPWPALARRISANEYTVAAYFNSFDVVTAPSLWRDGIALHPSLWNGRSQLRTHLPVSPTWPGFVATTALYASVLALIVYGPRHWRARARLRAGLCPRCKYPIASSPVCTECGHQFRHAPAQSLH